MQERAKVVLEVVLATAAVAAVLAGAEAAAALGPWGLEIGGLGVVLAMVGLPLALARHHRWQWDVLAMDPPLVRAALIGLAASAVVMPLFFLGYDVLQTQLMGRTRGSGPGLPAWNWWLEQAAIQLAAIALPEEMFFRGYVQGRLAPVFPQGRRLLGVPMGPAALLANLGFASVHLVAVPAPHRLLVFFPGLLFAWLRGRSNSAVSSAVCHACCNLALAAAVRLYA